MPCALKARHRGLQGVVVRSRREARHVEAARDCRAGGGAHPPRRAGVTVHIGMTCGNLRATDGTRLAFVHGMKRKHARNDWIPTLLLLPAAAFSQALQPAEGIQKAAEQFLTARLSGAEGVQVHVSADALDPRLRLPQCEQAPIGLLPQAARIDARATVGVRCAKPMWTVYVPVRVETELPVLVLRRALDRNSAVTEADVELKPLRVPGMPASYIGSMEQLAGRHLRRSAAPGTPLSVDMLGEDILVRHGQRVTLVASAGGLEVRAPGEAISDAGPNGRVRVLNLSSRRIVEGQVESRDVVRIGL